MSDPLHWLDAALADLDQRGLRRTLAERASPQRGNEIVLNGRKLVNFGSNDYLGLASDPRVIAAAKAAVDRYGWGSGASPLITGRSELHAELERKLAEFEGTEAALFFPSGYAANVGTICALVGKGDTIFSDADNHASIIDGCRLSGATIHIYRWPGWVKELEKLIKKQQPAGRILIVSDSLFSMHGGFASLTGLITIAEEHNAILMLDEAHATGVIGEHGRGLCELLKAESRVQVRVGTLSKGLGGIGGFVAGSQQLIDWLSNRARPYFFSTALPAAVAAAGLKALEIAHSEPDRRRRLRTLADQLKAKLWGANIECGGDAQIIPIFLRDPRRTMAAAAALRERGFLVPGIRPPSVPEGLSLLRISLTSLHTEEQIVGLGAALTEICRETP
jgi:8-amino-7-oxononanoate synthase